MTGHVFVIQGDTRRLACDAYLHATDRELRAGGGWMTSAPDAPNRLDPELRAVFQTEKRFALQVVTEAVSGRGRASKSWPVVSRMLEELGDGTRATKHSWSGLPEGLE